MVNGGTCLPAALTAGNSHLTVIVQDPLAARLVETHYGRPVIAQSPRVYLTRTQQRYDIIQLENWGTSLPGTSALTYANTLTVDALEQYLAHLNPKGILLLTRKLLLPPSDLIRLGPLLSLRCVIQV
jgi:hypothetical protein